MRTKRFVILSIIIACSIILSSGFAEVHNCPDSKEDICIGLHTASSTLTLHNDVNEGEVHLHLLNHEEKSIDYMVGLTEDSILQACIDEKASLYEFGFRTTLAAVRERQMCYMGYVNTNSGVYHLCFDAQGHFLSAFPVHYSVSTPSEMMNITPGTPVLDVCNVDPQGVFPFLYMSSKQPTQESWHYMADGTLYVIHYDEGNVESVTALVW